jgi:hypothetical protein
LKSIDKIFDSESLRERALNLLLDLGKEEVTQWIKHPCTQSLLLTLQGDYLDHHQAWEAGMFTADGAEGTAQQNAKALGAIDAVRLIATHIEDLDIYDTDDGI